MTRDAIAFFYFRRKVAELKGKGRNIYAELCLRWERQAYDNHRSDVPPTPAAPAIDMRYTHIERTP